jgi:EAL and modified HD-GYP domain-containing signal transduction protein
VGARFALLSKLADADVSIRDVESLVAADAALNYRLLRAANSAAAGLPRRVDSVRTAIVMLGLERLRSWLMLMTVAEHSDSHEAQLAAAATRARMCELLAARWAQVPAQGAFLMGLLSRLDLLLGVGMDTVVEGLPLEDTMQDALLHRAGSMGQLLGAVESYETYTQNPFSGALSLETFTDAYLASIAWSNALLDATRQAS